MGTTLTIIFIVLKVLDMVTFRWGIVFLPLILEWGAILLIIVVVGSPVIFIVAVMTKEWLGEVFGKCRLGRSK